MSLRFRLNVRFGFLFWVFGFGLCVLLNGCDASYDGLRFTMQSHPPVSVLVSDEQIQINVGIVAVVSAKVESNDEAAFKGAAIELISLNPEIAEVKQGIDFNELAILGKNVGNTVFTIWVDGKERGTVPVVIGEPSVEMNGVDASVTGPQ